MKRKVFALALVGVILGGSLAFADQSWTPALSRTSQSISQVKTVLTHDQVVEIAKKHAGVTQISNLNVKLEREDGRLEYDIRFTSGNTQYEYDIDAHSGKVWEVSKRDRNHKKNAPKAATPKKEDNNKNVSALSHDQAVEIAKKSAGVTKIEKLKVKLEYDDGRLEYDIEFFVGNRKYEYDVDAMTGAIREESIEREDHEWKQIPSNPNQAKPALISREKAVEIAKKAAGVTKITKLSVEREYDDGRYEYDIEFVSGGIKYEFDVDAVTGAVRDESIDYDDDDDDDVIVVPAPKAKTPAPAVVNQLNRDQALAIALKHAGVSYYEDLDIELDWYRGKRVYEIDFESRDLDYEYKIDAVSGAILYSEID